MGSGGSSKGDNYTRSVSHKDYTASTNNNGPSPSDDCDLINFRTTVSKPTAFIAGLHIGDALFIRLVNGILTLFNSNGDLCGIIVGPQAESMIKCINKGKSYQAIVEAISGMSCQVRVELRR